MYYGCVSVYIVYVYFVHVWVCGCGWVDVHWQSQVEIKTLFQNPITEMNAFKNITINCSQAAIVRQLYKHD